ncbi:helix-turn-helix transcriptional regulator [Neisseria animaloris]|uniref:helix-turn-helix transcriptional regulator n=1 Tax=Neisseria animaloris TaxID=326522 RepID=UPI0039E07039
MRDYHAKQQYRHVYDMGNEFILFHKEGIPAKGLQNRFHPYSRLIFSGNSSLPVTVGGDNEFTLPPKTVLFLSPYMLYSILPRREKTDSLLLNLCSFGLNVTASPFWENVRGLLESGKSGLHYSEDKSDFIYRVYDEIENGFDLKNLSKIIELLDHMTACMPQNSIVDKLCDIHQNNLHFCQTANEYIYSHLNCKGMVSEIAKQSHMSVSSFHQKFRQHFKESFHSYLLKQKIHLACNLLSTTSMTVAEIAEELNFNSPSHFTVIFKQHRQTTPGAYRTQAMRLKN